MPSLKSLSSKMLSSKMLGSMKKRGNDTGNQQLDGESARSADSDSAVDLQGDTPEALAARAVRAFCESGGPGQQNGDEVTYLPTIVESAESSPTAAADCAQLIRKFLKKDHWVTPSYQYNALMLARILADNPGPTFTRNLDAKFVDTLKDLLKNGRDLSVRQMLMETLDQFEHQKGWDEGLAGIIAMWKKEKDKAYKTYGGRLPPAPQPMMSGPGSAPPPNAHSQNYFARSHTNRRLPDPVELTNRLEEARTSAGLLTQLVANTPSTEVQDNDLVKEFADRCLSASRSIQMYMTAENPGPDNETMENLIDVNEALQQALNSQKRALLSARKEHGDRSQNPSPQPGSETNGAYPPPVSAPGGAFNGAAAAISRRDVPRPDKGKGRQEPLNKGKGREGAPDSVGYVAPPPGPPPPGRSGRPTDMVSPLTAEDVEDEDRNPFLDPHSAAGISERARGKAPAQPSALVSPVEHSTPVYEQYNPGFRQPTQCYLGRQESATGKVQMHGAVDLDESDHHLRGGARPVYAAAGSDTEESPVIPRKTQFQYDNHAYKAGGTGAAGAPRQHRYANEVDEEDLYHNNETETRENVAAGKRPVYRY